jgi:transcriptional regulator with XRE-family HTH domain
MAKPKPTIRSDVKHVLDTLKSAIRLLGYSVRDIEKALGYSFGYLSRVFAGIIELKMEHILDIAKALSMAPEELLAFVYPELTEPPSKAAVDLWKRVGGVAPTGTIVFRNQSKTQAMEDDMERAFRRTLARVLGGLVSGLREDPGEDFDSGITQPLAPK